MMNVNQDTTGVAGPMGIQAVARFSTVDSLMAALVLV